MGEAVRERGGIVQGFTGDGIMAVFGAPVAFEDAPLRACRAALAILQRLNEAGPDATRSISRTSNGTTTKVTRRLTPRRSCLLVHAWISSSRMDADKRFTESPERRRSTRQEVLLMRRLCRTGSCARQAPARREPRIVCAASTGTARAVNCPTFANRLFRTMRNVPPLPNRYLIHI